MRSGGRSAPDQLPGHTESTEPSLVEAVLQPGQERVLLVADVLAQHFDQALEEPRAQLR
jgi:hypothetical protein